VNSVSGLAEVPARSTLRDYAAESARPLVCLAFIAPLLVVYELGGLLLGPHALRNGADSWLRLTLESIGFGQYFLLPILTCGLLLGWHHMRQDTWRFDVGTLSVMFLESTLCAFALFGLAHLHHACLARVPAVITPDPAEGALLVTASRLVAYCGAGIYEELLFRLMLLPAVAGLCQLVGLSRRSSWLTSIVATSLFFSAAHYHGFTVAGYAFDWYSFSFRFAAGLAFSALFVLRGFGIVVGTHAIYDILVELL
jgi:membrane protease YdiL (CAAX protease family)